LNEYKVCFSPQNASAIVVNGTTTIHCSTTSRKVGVLGMAFVQKHPTIVQMNKALDAPDFAIGKTYIKAKIRYEDLREQYQGQGVASFHYCRRD
jgi:hypothetical protein